MLPLQAGDSPCDVALEALGNPVRRRILRLLAERRRSVGELAEVLPVSRPAVSRHLRLLSDAGLVRHESAGTQNLYGLEPTGFEQARAWLDSFWDQALSRFAMVAENTGGPGDEG